MRYAKVENNIIKTITTHKVDGFIDISDLTIANILNRNIWDCYKEMFKKQLWQLLPSKVKASKKVIIEKPEMSDDELDIQIELYLKKYEDAKAGLDVFEGQALALGITQDDYRALVIQKGDAFLQAEKAINDRIELVRSLMEKEIDKIDTPDDIEVIEGKFDAIESFTINTPVQDIIDAIKSD